MRKVVVVLLMLVAATSFAAKQEARIDSVAVTQTGYLGSYGGPDAMSGLVLESHNGKLHGNYVEHGRLAVLSPIEVRGAEFTATASFDDGSYRTISGRFTGRGAVVEGTFLEKL